MFSIFCRLESGGLEVGGASRGFEIVRYIRFLLFSWVVSINLELGVRF